MPEIIVFNCWFQGYKSETGYQSKEAKYYWSNPFSNQLIKMLCIEVDWYTFSFFIILN
jgi:hypothetical protein